MNNDYQRYSIINCPKWCYYYFFWIVQIIFVNTTSCIDYTLFSCSFDVNKNVNCISHSLQVSWPSSHISNSRLFVTCIPHYMITIDLLCLQYNVATACCNVADYRDDGYPSHQLYIYRTFSYSSLDACTWVPCCVWTICNWHKHLHIWWPRQRQSCLDRARMPMLTCSSSFVFIRSTTRMSCFNTEYGSSDAFRRPLYSQVCLAAQPILFNETLSVIKPRE